MTRTDRIDLLVLGLGNVLCGDDGAGVIALHRLRRNYELPDNVRLVDGGTLGLDLLALVAASDSVIMIDAVRADSRPGTIVVLEDDEVAPAVYERLSPHQIGVADLVAGAALVDRYPENVVIVGVVPETTDLQFGCSAAVEAKLPQLVDRVIDELHARGVRVVPRAEPLPAEVLGL